MKNPKKGKIKGLKKLGASRRVKKGKKKGKKELGLENFPVEIVDLYGLNWWAVPIARRRRKILSF